MSIGDNIKKYRIKKEMSQEKLSSMVSISSRTLQNYEADKTIPPIDVLIKLSNVLEVGFTQIAGDNEKILNDVMVGTCCAIAINCIVGCAFRMQRGFTEDPENARIQNNAFVGIAYRVIAYVHFAEKSPMYMIDRVSDPPIRNG